MIRKNIISKLICALLIGCLASQTGAVFAEPIKNDTVKVQKHDERLTDKLNTLVEKKVITNNEAVKIKEYLKVEREERHKKFEKIKQMTQEERKEYFKNNKMQRKSLIEKMVEDKVITEEQAKEIKNVMPWLDKSRNKNHKHQCPENRKQ